MDVNDFMHYIEQIIKNQEHFNYDSINKNLDFFINKVTPQHYRTKYITKKCYAKWAKYRECYFDEHERKPPCKA